MSWKHDHRLVKSSIIIVCAVILSTSCSKQEPEKPVKQESVSKAASFMEAPPGVERATIQPLKKSTAEGNALLTVKFDSLDNRITEKMAKIPLKPGEKEIVLNDAGKAGDLKAGDGLYSAVVDFDFEIIARMAKVAESRLEKRAPQPIFLGREIIGVENMKLASERIMRLQELGNAQEILRDLDVIDLSDLFFLFDVLAIAPERSLIVTDASVVEDPLRTVNPCTEAGDPDGVWTFKHLVTEMVAGTGVDPADFVEQWLQLWASPQTVSSGFIAAPRSKIQDEVLDPWPRTGAGKLDLDKSPFRLSAIVNRIDLAENLVYGAGSAGEGRFVFGVQDRTNNGGSCQFLQFSVILEYGVERSGCIGLKSWAEQWAALSSLSLGSPEYNTALETITEQFAAAGAAPGKPNGSALNQLRTNENALNSLWELREFQISESSHMLVEVTTKQSPDETLNNTSVLADYVNSNAAAIKLDAHEVPDHFPGAEDPFLAATSRAFISPESQFDTHFRATGITDNDARFHLSLNTCSGCHIRETSTNGQPGGNNAFLHIDPKVMPARLSRFMTGSTPSITDSPDPFSVADPVDLNTHNFNDLDRRRRALAARADMECIAHIVVPPLELLERWPWPIPPGKLPPIPDPRLDGVMDPIRMVH